ncbi:cupin domain-containing protein [Pedobacter rhizosphaerae]|uniref:Cupin domain-containing protein n=1 Tax=Pedobacter rhizosphaerae TaxID=390241 RepID=A0A1H9U6E5_9SPHI|nr:cupin domain-containing protein [Pedobacter rhizosphaerae]SES04919.1 Cupin domain-containing protein [Pedobacter rhizosphaerae]
MKNIKKLLIAAITITGVSLFLTPDSAFAQTGVKRTDLQRHDISVPGHEAVQATISFEKGSAFGKHNHPGEEVIYVLAGTLQYEVEGQKPVILKAGEVLFIPAGKAHSAKNVGNNKAVELATYIVEKGKPILTLVK